MAGPLDPYYAKRDLSRSGEPAGGKTPSADRAGDAGPALGFVVQKHAARRLHYDFRLELDGVLKSWAVTRGPSLVPGDKRLAVHVEDHPLDYATFEGRIPEGNYGAGEVIVWDRGTWEPVGDPHRGLAKGHLDFRLNGEKLSGEWHLVRLRERAGEKRENWLLIKAHDEAARTATDATVTDAEPRSVLSGRTIEEIAADAAAPTWESNRPAQGTGEKQVRASAAARPRKASSAAKTAATAEPKRKASRPARARSKSAAPAGEGDADPSPSSPGRGDTPPDFVPPCLARLVAATPSGDRWLHEIKFDGYRIQARLAEGQVTLRTRTGLDWTARLKPSPFAQALSGLPAESALIDGEIVVEDAGGVSDFAALQAALSADDRGRLVYWVFDLLHLDGRDLTCLPLVDRKQALADLVGSGTPALRYSDHMEEGGEALLRHACRLSLEGIISKLRDAPYRSGRGGEWVKSKCANRQEFVIGGYTPSTAQRRAIGSLALGSYQGDRLVYAGRVGSGFTSAQASDLWAELESLRAAESPFAGALPAEARRNVRWVSPKLVAEVEFRGRTGTDALRQAVFHGLRRDKPAEQVQWEGPADSPPPADPRPEAASSVHLTHPDRLFWPEAGITKQGLYDFYAAIWDRIAPHIVRRPLSLVRCPGGVTEECFFQKHAWKGLDEHVHRGRDGAGEEFLFIEDFDGLAALVQAGVLEIHPWGSRIDSIESPDRITFDLDPGEDVGWGEVIEAAREVRERLTRAGLESFVKTTGGKGLHVVVPFLPGDGWDAAKEFTREIAEAMAADRPDRYTAVLSKASRKGKIFIDYLRNGRGATAVAAYSTRNRPSAGVSTPVAWDELGPELTADRFRVNNLLNRLDHLAQDPWEGFFDATQRLPVTPRKKTRR